jgi:competence protein ComEC
MANYGLLANLAAAPIMSFWVAPMGALAGLGGLVGLHEWPLQAMGWGIAAILRVAEFTAGLPGAVRMVSQPPAAALPLVTLGGLWLALWRSRLRLAGLAPLALGLGLWLAGAPRPEVLVAPEAATLGALGPEGRAVDRARGAGYAVATWLAHDGDPAPQGEAAGRPGLSSRERSVRATLSNGWEVILLKSLTTPARLDTLCAPRTLLLAWGARDAAAAPRGGCRFLARPEMQTLGALSVQPDGDRIRIRGARTETAGRFWSSPAEPDAAP